MRHDVTLLVEALRQQEGERWALCFENSYLFIVALLASLHAGKTPVIPGHSRVSLLDEQQSLFSGVLSDQTLDIQGKVIVVTSSPRPRANGHRCPSLTTRALLSFYLGLHGHPTPGH